MSRLRWMVLLALLSGPANAEEPERLLRFGDSLLLNGEPYRAITEYMRYASYFPDQPEAAQMPLRISLAYLYGGRPEQALTALAPALRSERPDLREQAAYLQARCYYEAGEMELLLRGWADPKDTSLAPLLRQQRLQALLRLDRRKEAIELLQAAGYGGLDRPVAESLAERLAQSPAPDRRSPVLAGVLSGILPGAGQLYAGRKRDAVVSLLLNGLFVFGAVQAFRGGNEATGILLSSAEIGWYSGNIASAASGARSYNRRRQERYLREVADLPTLEAQSRVREAELLLGVNIAF